MDEKNTPLPLIGLIEGFYGRPYPDPTREELYAQLGALHFGAYIYAPKNVDPLRKRWREGFTPDELTALSRSARRARECGLKFGVGFTPLGLGEDKAGLDLLIERLKPLAGTVGLDLLAILFDDLKLEKSDEGRLQNRILQRIWQEFGSTLEAVFFCPTYYSTDPILERLFGPRPKDYFRDLMTDLPAPITPFWTGRKVVPPSVEAADVAVARQLLGRPVALWDNYPVNDGKRLCDHLYTRPFAGRRGLSPLIRAHFANPMVEPLLSLLALSSLPLIHTGEQAGEISRVRVRVGCELMGNHFAELEPLLKRAEFPGRTALTARERFALLMLCGGHGGAREELLRWSLGEYAFDPACLT